MTVIVAFVATAGLLVPVTANGTLWPGAAAQSNLSSQSAEEVARKSDGCMSCHVYEDPDTASMPRRNP